MLSDTLASANFTGSGFINTCDTLQPVGRVRIKAVYYVATTTGVLTFTDGSATGTVRLPVSTAASASGLVIIPGEGIVFQKTPFVTVTGTLAGATVFYG